MPSIIRCKFCEPSADNFNVLRSYLPGDYEYLICSFSASSTNFKTRLRTNGKNQDHAHKWLEEFQMHTKLTMRVERTYPHCGTKNVFKVDLRCQHNTRPRNEKVREKESCKNTDCPAKMGITIKRVVTERKSRSKDPHLPDYPTVIQINSCHNHEILTPEILKHRSVLPEVKEKLLNLFKLGHNPSTALDMHKYDLLLEHGENFEKILHDRAILPDSQFCYRLYYKIIKKQAFPMNIENTECDIPAMSASPHKKAITPLSNCENSSILNSSPKDTHSNEISCIAGTEKKAKKKRKLEHTVFDQNELTKQISAEMYKFCKSGGIAGMLKVDESNSVMALCTPLMLRVHSFLKHSGELVFVDTYGELDEPNSCRIYMFLTYSSIGAVPLGCVVTTSTTPICMKAALDLWKQILPPERFYNKSEGPDIIFTNDSEAEKQVLRSSFPKSQLLMCISHILQSSWIFLLDRKNTIKKEHRSLFFSKIKMLLFSQTVEELEMNYSYAVGDNLVKSNVLFLDYLNHIYNHRHDWSLVYCRHLLPRADDVSIFWESALIILKDPILSRARTYNHLQILDFLSRLDTFYERKLIDLANNRFDSMRLSRFLLIDLPREAYTITQFSEIEYEVHNDSKDTTYQVDVSLGVCECRTGKSGAPCKHQLLVLRNFSVPVYDCVPLSSPAEKDILFLLATGYSVMNSESMSESVSKAVSTSVPEIQQKSLCMTMQTTEIIIQDLDPCTENAFFLDDSGTCENLNQSLNQPASIVNLSSNSLVQTTTVLEQHSASVITSEDPILSPHNLLSQLDQSSPQHISLNNELTPLDQHLSSSNINPSPTPPDPTLHSSPPCEPILCEAPTENTLQVIDDICSELKERTSKSPTTFKPALNTFLKNLEKLTSDSSLEYALYSFGKFSKSATPLFKRKIADNKLIGLQTTGELKKRRQPFKCSKVHKKSF